MSVVFTGYKTNVGVNLSVSYIVDWSLYLPEWVTLGFSATKSQGACKKVNVRKLVPTRKLQGHCIPFHVYILQESACACVDIAYKGET